MWVTEMRVRSVALVARLTLAGLRGLHRCFAVARSGGPRHLVGALERLPLQDKLDAGGFVVGGPPGSAGPRVVGAERGEHVADGAPRTPRMLVERALVGGEVLRQVRPGGAHDSLGPGSL